MQKMWSYDLSHSLILRAEIREIYTKLRFKDELF